MLNIATTNDTRPSIFVVTTTAAIVLLLSACSPAVTAEQTPSAAATSAAPLPKVSLATSCELLFGSNVDGPIADTQAILTRFTENPDLSTITENELTSTIAGLETVRKNADEAIVPYVEAQIAPLNALLEAKRTGKTTNIDFTDYKSSGIELINQCERYL